MHYVGSGECPAQWLLSAAIAYTISPIVPFPGHFDDVVIVPAIVILALKFIPKEVVEDCRRRVVEST
jgi:uncharacterized membrane protein YkvA (DUF1232 family)